MRAEVRAGELLIKMADRKERAGLGHGSGKGRKPLPLVKLDDLGVSKTQSSRWQAFAKLPPKEQEEKIARAAPVCRPVIGSIHVDCV